MLASARRRRRHRSVRARSPAAARCLVPACDRPVTTAGPHARSQPHVSSATRNAVVSRQHSPRETFYSVVVARVVDSQGQGRRLRP